jgi:hypothetical protein
MALEESSFSKKNIRRRRWSRSNRWYMEIQVQEEQEEQV